ncbi:hypothetical protein F5887DRAFT_935605 [Amanita rubescens]|nr:hypothetical protein F5887DRAFT_935605 [Amanita rubescens]
MPDYSPQEDRYTLFLEKTFMTSNFVAGIGYGVQLLMYAICASYLWNRRNPAGRIRFLHLAYITVLILLESLFVASSTWTLEEMYINNRNYPGGPMAWFLVTQNAPENTFFASLFSLTFLSDLLVLWRCWVVWDSPRKRTPYMIISFPALVLLSSVALGIIWAYRSCQPGLSGMYSSYPLVIGTIYYAGSLGANIVLTTLIIFRLLLHRSTVSKTLPDEYARPYSTVVAIVVESALLYTIFALAFVISYALNNPINQVFMCMGSACQQIAGYLIILRVAQGRAWPSNTVTKGAASEPISSLRFNTQLPASQGVIEVQCISSYDEYSWTASAETKLHADDSV